MPRANSARTYHLITCDLSVPQDVGAPKDRQMFLASVGRNAGPVENFVCVRFFPPGQPPRRRELFGTRLLVQ